MMIRCLGWAFFLCLSLWAAPALAGEKTEPGELIVVDQEGKEHKLKDWKFTSGTRKLSWLAPAGDKEPAKGKKPAPAGPEAFVVSEGELPPLKTRVLTFVPLTSIRSIDYDNEGKKISVRVAVNDKEEDDAVLRGITGYVNTNSIAVEALMDLGELGQATVRFQGGVDKGAKSFRFTHPKPLPAPTGRMMTIKQQNSKLPAFKVGELQVLYDAAGQEKALPTLFFKETVKIDLAKVQKMSQIGGTGVDFQVTLTDSKELPALVLIERPKDPDGKGTLQLQGLIGRSAAGWQLFPMITIGELQVEQKRVDV
jgi:hypothetical protein